MAKATKRPPSVAALTATAVVSLIVGMLAAATSLALRYVPEVSPKAEPPPAGTVYYAKGDVSESSGWPQRMKAVEDARPGTYTFVEGDLNAWTRAHLRPTPAPKQGESAPAVMVVEFPNFNVLDDGRLQVAMRIEAPGLLPGRTVVYQSRGRVVNGQFTASEGWIGGSPVPLVNKLVFRSVTRTLQPSGDAVKIAEALKKAKVAIDSGKIMVAMP